MNDLQLIELIEKEFKEKRLGVTEQYLEIHSPIYVNDKIKVDRIDRDRMDKLIIAYLPVLEEKFYFAVYIDTNLNEITNIGTEANIRVYFRADSDKFTLDELAKMTNLKSTRGRSIGDERRKGIFWKESTIFYEADLNPDEFEDKLNKLLDFLEQDKDGVKCLVEKADGYIQVAMEIHNGNGMIGGPHIDKNVMRRINDLNVSMNFDLYVGGSIFKN